MVATRATGRSCRTADPAERLNGAITTAAEFTAAIKPLASDEQREKYSRYFKMGPGEYGEGDEFIGVAMGDVFATAKRSLAMPPDQIELLMESSVHEHRAGAMSTMDKQARAKKTDDERRRELHDLYLRRIDRVNNWDLVDLAAAHVIGGYLHRFELPRALLCELARSDDMWERRTSIVATSYFISKGETADTFAVAELLVDDDEDLIHKAVGGWIRHAGIRDPDALDAFLETHAAKMPRTMLSYAVEKLSPEKKAYFRGLA
jgi:3-methyladenine DNA glycosylase AlkD